MSTRRTAVRRTLRLAVATSLVAAPAALVMGTSQAAEVTDSMGQKVSAARAALDTGVLSTAVGAAADSEQATRPVAETSAIAAKMVRPDARPSRSGARIVPLVRAEPMRVAPSVTMDEKPTWVLPVSGYDLTGRFGSVSGLWSSSHTGLDFAAPSGTPIRSVADGVVTEAGYDGAYGYKTVVSLPDGGEVWYCHQNEISVSKGQTLSAGEVLGYVGTSGNVTGSHLHLEVRHGDTPVDPESYLAEQGIAP
jgi:murein DD-endopeptidase MepM/ murein hydrolase activator NlpD